MTITLAGAPLRPADAEVLTGPHLARAWCEFGTPVAVQPGDPCPVAGPGGQLLAGEVTEVQRSVRHTRLLVGAPVLLDMQRREVEAHTATEALLPTVLAHVLGDHTVAVLPPLNAVTLPHWSTRRRTQGWALASVLRTLAHVQVPAAWRYDARGDRLVIAAPDDDAERMAHDELVVLGWHGGAREVAERAGVQAGDLVRGQRVSLVRTVDQPGYRRQLLWLDPSTA